MGYAELIAMLEKLPPERQAEVFDFAEFIAARANAAGADNGNARRHILAALQTARESFPPCSPDQLRRECADMRNEWGGRGWEAER